MEIKANKQVIESIITTIYPFLEKKDDTQITSHVYIKALPNICIFKGTDKEIGLRIISEQFLIEEEGEVTVNGKKLLGIIRILKDEDIILKRDDNYLIIKQKSSKFKLPLFDPTSYPNFPTIENKPKIALDTYNLIKNLKKIIPTIDNNNPKYELNGALINIKKESIDLVGSDTKRLAIVVIEGKSEEQLSLILPKKAILEIQKLFLDDIEIYYDDTNLIITNKNYFFYTRLINGEYPNYERIIPKSIKSEITLPKKEMIESIRMITTISNEIKLIIEPKKIVFESLSTDVEAKTELEIDTNIEDRYEININSKHVLDFISQTESGSFILGINDSRLPFILKENNFTTIIMPIINV